MPAGARQWPSRLLSTWAPPRDSCVDRRVGWRGGVPPFRSGGSPLWGGGAVEKTLLCFALLRLYCCNVHAGVLYLNVLYGGASRSFGAAEPRPLYFGRAAAS